MSPSSVRSVDSFAAPDALPVAPDVAIDQVATGFVFTEGALWHGVQQLAAELEQPNGLCFRADESQLLINDSPRKRILAFTLQDDGTLRTSRHSADTPGDEAGVPDGMKFDSQGHLYCWDVGFPPALRLGT